MVLVLGLLSTLTNKEIIYKKKEVVVENKKSENQRPTTVGHTNSIFDIIGTLHTYVGPQIGMKPKPILGLPDYEY